MLLKIYYQRMCQFDRAEYSKFFELYHKIEEKMINENLFPPQIDNRLPIIIFLVHLLLILHYENNEPSDLGFPTEESYLQLGIAPERSSNKKAMYNIFLAQTNNNNTKFCQNSFFSNNFFSVCKITKNLYGSCSKCQSFSKKNYLFLPVIINKFNPDNPQAFGNYSSLPVNLENLIQNMDQDFVSSFCSDCRGKIINYYRFCNYPSPALMFFCHRQDYSKHYEIIINPEEYINVQYEVGSSGKYEFINYSLKSCLYYKVDCGKYYSICRVESQGELKGVKWLAFFYENSYPMNNKMWEDIKKDELILAIYERENIEEISDNNIGNAINIKDSNYQMNYQNSGGVIPPMGNNNQIAQSHFMNQGNNFPNMMNPFTGLNNSHQNED